jgi:hypothetical protein
MPAVGMDVSESSGNCDGEPPGLIGRYGGQSRQGAGGSLIALHGVAGIVNDRLGGAIELTAGPWPATSAVVPPWVLVMPYDLS